MWETARRLVRWMVARLDVLIGSGSLLVWWTSQVGIVMSPALVAAQSTLRSLLIPLIGAFLGAMLRHRRREAVLVVIAGAFIVWALVPLVRGAEPPRWTTTAPSLKVAAANVFAGNVPLLLRQQRCGWPGARSKSSGSYVRSDESASTRELEPAVTIGRCWSPMPCGRAQLGEDAGIQLGRRVS